MARPKTNPTPSPAAKVAALTVTAGNIVFDRGGNRCLEGDVVDLPADVLAELKAAGLVA